MTDIEQRAREVAEWFGRKYMTPKRSPTYCIEDMAKEVSAAIQSAVEEEREACAKVIERDKKTQGLARVHLAAAIRARASAKEKP